MKTQGKASQDYLNLVNYLKQQVDGAILTYEQIRNHTAVTMDTAGKSKLRQAVKAVKRRYDIMRGVGIILDSAQNTPMISDSSVKRIAGAIRRSRKTHDVLEKHLEDMPPSAQEIFRFRQTVLITIDTEMERATLTEKPKVRQITDGKPILPENI